MNSLSIFVNLSICLEGNYCIPFPMKLNLFSSSSGERVRWTEASKTFQEQINRLVGDVLIATGFLSYAGPFNQDFRNLIQKNWKRELVQNKIPYSDVS